MSLLRYVRLCLTSTKMCLQAGQRLLGITYRECLYSGRNIIIVLFSSMVAQALDLLASTFL